MAIFFCDSLPPAISLEVFEHSTQILVRLFCHQILARGGFEERARRVSTRRPPAETSEILSRYLLGSAALSEGSVRVEAVIVVSRSPRLKSCSML